MQKISTNEWDGVAMTNDVTVEYFNFINRSAKRIGYTRDILRLQNPVFFFGKNSLLTSIFNEKIEHCQESGLITHWVSKFKPNQKKQKHKQLKQLGFPNIVAMLKISGVLCLISCFVLFMEILTPTNRMLRIFLDFLTY